MENKSKYCIPLAIPIFLFLYCTGMDRETEKPDLSRRARIIAQSEIIVDSHIDVPYRLHEKPQDISIRTENGHFDYPRAREGGLNVAFWAIYVPSYHYQKGGGKQLTDKLIDMVDEFPQKWPDKFAVVTSVNEVKDQIKSDKVLVALGIENGEAIEEDLQNLAHFYNRRVRYITLTHGENNRICDSATDDTQLWSGLSPFGRKVVEEMNRLGIMIDVSHISDSSFYQVMAISKAPVIASHSACRELTPGFKRNMDDRMIRLLAEKGGVINIGFGSYFIHSDYITKTEILLKKFKLFLKEHQLTESDSAAIIWKRNYRAVHPAPAGQLSDLVDHIDHVVQLVGVEHVGFGSDFEGVLSLPDGIEDVSDYPQIIRELLKRGYQEEDIKKICGENMLRVWSQVEKAAQKNS